MGKRRERVDEDTEGLVSDFHRENFHQGVDEGLWTYASLARQAADGGDPATAKWAAAHATAAELRKQELTKQTAEAEAVENLNAGTPPVTVTGLESLDPTTPEPVKDAVVAATNESKRVADDTKPASKR